MSPVAIALDILLAGLLLAALFVGVRLNARLQALRQSHAGFVQAVADLNRAASRAEGGLAALRSASEETHDALLARIETARALSVKLERATFAAEKAIEAASALGTPAVHPAPADAEPARFGAAQNTPPRHTPILGSALTSLAALASLTEPAAQGSARAAKAADASPAPGRRARPSFDEDLFQADAPASSLVAANASPSRRAQGERR